MKASLRKFVPEWLIRFYHNALVAFAAYIYNFPSRRMIVVGVTGTNGKTTTVNLISQILEEAGIRTGYATTANFKVGGKKWINETKQTMQGRFRLQKILFDMWQKDTQVAIIETSSEGILQARHKYIEYDVLVFTNLSPEHIEAHGSYEAYRQAKEVVFAGLMKRWRKDVAGMKKVPKTFVVNGADEAAHSFLRYEAEKKIIYWAEDKDDADRAERVYKLAQDYKPWDVLMARDVRPDDHTEFDLVGLDGKPVPIKTGLRGLFNVENALAAIGAAKVFNVGLRQIQSALLKVSFVPGRLEQIDVGQAFDVFVDYAHEPRGLETVLKVMRARLDQPGGGAGGGQGPVGSGKLIVLTGGQGGGRDKSKRPVMGRLAAEYGEIVIVANEDPYDDDPRQIVDEVAAGALEKGKALDKDLFKIDDRKAAIRKAISLADEGDVVLIAGKGAERHIVSKNGKKIPHDDREVAMEALSVITCEC